MMAEPEDDVLKLVRAPTLVRQLAADTLRQAIVTGTLPPGERLVESSLAKRMGVSRPSIREALSQLAAEKIVTITPNRGPAVATISWKEAASIYEVRALLESDAAARCARLATKEDIGRMRRALREFERALAKDDIAKLVASTGEFYTALLGACDNPVITEILEQLTARISFLRARSMSREGRASRSLVELSVILDAIERHDAEAARSACSAHVEQAKIAAKTAFEEMRLSE